MEHLVMSKYGENFMSIITFDNLFNNIKNDISFKEKLIINLDGVNNISPSFMTRLINKLIIELDFQKIEIENANKRLETTFKFALNSIRQKEMIN